MKKAINSLPQAKDEMKHVASIAEQVSELNGQIRESVEALQKFFEGILPSAPAAPTKQRAITKAARPASATLHDSGLRAVAHTPAPPTVAERVLYIMRDIGEPVLPKEIARHYLLRDWPLPKKGTIYNLISGTVTYLYLRKRVLVRSPEGYSLPHDDIYKLMMKSPKEKGEGVRAKKRAEKKLSVEPMLPLKEVEQVQDDLQQPVAL
jgi:hypothetical protein